MSRPLAVRALLATTLAACGGGGGGEDAGLILRPDGDMDLDLDGVKDDVDNCPTATNFFQGNEDADALGDACDPCPHVPGDLPDSDGDGVADACDPKPGYPGDRIAFFEGFHQGVPQGWEAVGSWSTSNDQLVGSAAGAGHLALIVTDQTRETVSALITVTSVAGATSELGVIDNKAAGGAGASAIACTLRGDDQLAVYATTDASAATTAPGALTAGQTYLLRLRRENSDYTCSAEAAGANPSVTSTLPLYNAPYLSGITLTGASIRVHWLMVVESL